MSNKIMKRRRFPGPGGSSSGAYEPSSIISGDFEQQSHPSDISSNAQPDEELSSQGYARSHGRIMIDSPSRRGSGLAKVDNGNFSEDRNTDDFEEVDVSPEKKISSSSVHKGGDSPQHANNANGGNGIGIDIGDDDGTDINTSTDKKSAIFQKFMALLCPCVLLCQALFRCDMGLFWKLCSSLFVLKAFYSSVMVIGLCNIFKVHRIIPNNMYVQDYTADPALAVDTMTNRVETYLFGLWTYTNDLQFANHDNYSLGKLLKEELEEIESCRFHMQTVDQDAPDGLFLNDASFTVARVFACLVVAIGFISMILVWCSAANSRGRCLSGRGGQRMRSMLPLALLLCCIFECFVFLILASSVCRDSEFDEQRHCTLQEGSSLLFASIIGWLVSFLGMSMVNRTQLMQATEVFPSENDDGDGGDNDGDDAFQDHKLDDLTLAATFDSEIINGNEHGGSSGDGGGVSSSSSRRRQQQQEQQQEQQQRTRMEFS